MQRSKQFMRVGSSTIRWKRGYHQQISKQPIQQELSESLKDSFGRKHNYLRISLSERCNLRCQYCMPEEGVTLTSPDHLMSTNELLRIANLFISEGVYKIRLTGGEPLVRKDIIQICKELKSNKQLKTLGITTNGVTLKRHLATLKEVGVTHLNISLDTLQPQKFEFITRRKGWSKVLDSIEASLLHGFNAVKLNCVVMKGLNEDELVDFVKFTEDKNIEVRFIEYMPFDGNKWSVNKFYPYQAMLDKIKVVYPELQRLSDAPNDTSKTYQVNGFKGRIGFITSMSENFCSSCNRLRITSDGKLKVCLFGPKEVSLIDAIRCGMSDEDLLEIISSAVRNKKKQHAGMMNISKTKNRPMILVGG